ncbi:hypothetical protein BZG36_03770 [Bifiguratus adelaidae]|uniref:eIF-2-alpha kinase activator GCN1 n=1 Tax=Bifiguratus adelaidae TaxID=1938954 RepID=A0A261Y083_9FUNG|nr:hypothetical protein BZG36_03770 [Bifiguratus adelaidae]
MAREDVEATDQGPSDSSWAELLRSSDKTNLEALQYAIKIKAGRQGTADLDDITAKTLPPVLQLLFSYGSARFDRKSRLTSVEILRDLAQWNAGLLLESIMPILRRELDRMLKGGPEGYATSSTTRFNILVWICTIFAAAFSAPDTKSVQVYFGPLLDGVIGLIESLSFGDDSKVNLKRSAIVQTRRMLRKCLTKVEDILQHALHTPTIEPPYKKAPFLGVVIGTLLHAKQNVKDAEQVVEKYKSDILKFYVAHIISSKTIVPEHCATGLNIFFQRCVTEDGFVRDVLPTLEKMVLRSPEAALYSIALVISGLSFDPSQIFGKGLLEQLLNQLRSSSEVVRKHAESLWMVLAQFSRQASHLQVIVSQLSSLLTNNKVTNADQRAAFYRCLGQLASAANPEISRSSLTLCLKMVSKEANETAATFAIDAAGKHWSVTLAQSASQADAGTDAIKAAMTGMTSTKAAIRKAWACAVGDMLWSAGASASDALKKASVPLVKSMLASFNKLATNPLTFKDGPLEGYVLAATLTGRLREWAEPAALELVKSEKIEDKCLATAPKPSFLVWDRIYTKLTAVEELSWFIRALESITVGFDEKPDQNQAFSNMVAYAWIYLITRAPQHESRRTAYETLSKLNQSHPLQVGPVLRQGLRQWVLDLEHKPKDALPVQLLANAPVEMPSVTNYKLSRLLTSITTFKQPRTDKEQTPVLDALAECFLLAHHPAIISPTAKYDWISLVQRTMSDPGKLVETYSPQLQGDIEKHLTSRRESGNFYQAALNGIATLVFINPDTYAPHFIDFVKKDLDPSLTRDITPKDIAIWSLEDGQLFENPLNKNKTVEDKNAKDYAERKWAQETREALAKKKGVTLEKKLTKEEQATVNAQLAKEKAVRERVASVSEKVHQSLDLIRALSRGNHDYMAEQLVTLVQLVLDAGESNAGLVAGYSLFETFQDMSQLTGASIEEIQTPLAVSIFRGKKITPLPSEWTHECMKDLVSRVIYRLRAVSENNPLSPASFSFCFPLLHQILRQEGIDCNKSTDEGKEDAQEQVMIATDVLGFHCAQGFSDLLPRKDMIEALLAVIKDYPMCAKTSKASLLTLTESMGGTATFEEKDKLLKGLLSEDAHVRLSALQALDFFDLSDVLYSPELWIALYDADSTNASTAEELWDDNEMTLKEDFSVELLDLVTGKNAYIRTSASKGLAAAVKEYPVTLNDILHRIFSRYADLSKSLDPEYDEYGMIRPETLNRKDPWEDRVGLALALKELAPLFDDEALKESTQFLIEHQALGDRHESVREHMLNAGLALVEAHKEESLRVLMPLLQSYLDAPDQKDETHDRIRQAVVILFGAVASYLPEGDARIEVALEKLIDTLSTPSETVQSSVADCLPPLVKLSKSLVPGLVDRLFEGLLNGEKYAQRRGSAYGLAGVVKGRGISALKDCNIMERLKQAAENKKMYQHRQGAVMAFETLSATLKRLFEPYVPQILPLLLACFGDPNSDVREATLDASRIIMGQISGHCVKLILPSLLQGLEERQWRTKKGSVELLGSMAYCAPKQLSISLPTVVPRLTEVLTDTHAQVQNAANNSLLQFGEVINNPEIQTLVPVLLDALSQPNNKTKPALEALLQTVFVHYIDSPSLALVIPILQRGLRDRTTEIKTKASQIVGNMSTLTDQKDLIPYLSELLPGVKEVLVDPVPEARATAAKALGSLVEKLGEQNFPHLVEELLSVLKSDSSGVDRQGAAQGLSEVLAGLGIDRLDGLLPDIISNADSPKAFVREGFISLLIYLPATFGARFQPYLGRIIPPILLGLADESEYVRDASLRAGQMIVVNYATKAVDLLLPELENGLFDDNWRIRQSSVQLVGDLLFRITGVTKKSTVDAINGDANADADADAGAEEEEAVGQEAKKKALLEVLGKDRRDRVLAALYIVRQDVSGIVRQAALQVWKGVVSNTPRTIKEILPVVMTMIIRNVASSSHDRRAVAARTLGDLVRKLGESVLNDIVPILTDGLNSDDIDTRQGVSIALSEIMETAGRMQVLDYAEPITDAVKLALCDESPEVREAAAHAFDLLHQNIGPRAIDDVLPTLLLSLQSSDERSEYALEALKEIMTVRANVVFPVLIPTLTGIPISTFNAKALAALVSVAGTALNRRLANILAALLESLRSDIDEENREQVQETLKALVLSIEDIDGLHNLMMTLQEYVKSDDPFKRAKACDVVAIFYSESKLNASQYLKDWVRVLVSLLGDRASEVVPSAWNALNAVVKSLKKDDLEQLVQPMRQAIKSLAHAGVDVPGFCLPKGISPVLPVYLQGLMYGATDVREQSALGIGELIQRTSSDALKPFVTQITGPLIRIIGDRYPPQVKAAILQTLSTLLSKVPTHLKPFLPQLQRTFIKSLTDASSSSVRSRAAAALGILISLQTRVDPLIAELVAGIKAAEPEVKETMIQALQTVVSKAGSAMSDASKTSLTSVVTNGISDANEGVCIASATLLGSMCEAGCVEEMQPMIKAYVIGDEDVKYSAMIAINAILAKSPATFDQMNAVQEVLDKISLACETQKTHIPELGILAAGKFLIFNDYQTEAFIPQVLNALLVRINRTGDGTAETKRMALMVIRAVARKNATVLQPYLDLLIPPLLSCARDRNIPVKLTAERALLHTLQLLDSEDVMKAYLDRADETASKALSDYHRRILSKLQQQESSRLQLLHGEDKESEEEDAELYQIGTGGANNQVLWIFMGDRTPNQTTNMVYTFDTTSNTFSTPSFSSSALTELRKSTPQTTRLSDGKIFVFGGTFSWNENLPDNELFIFSTIGTPTFNSVTPTGSFPSPRLHHSISMLSNGWMVVIGGYDNAMVPMNQIWVFDTLSGQWAQVTTSGNTPTSRRYHAAAVDSNNKIYVFGGSDQTYHTCYNDMAVLDPFNNWTWTVNPGSSASNAPTGRYAHTMDIVGNNAIIAFGYQCTESGDKGIYVYNTASSSWTSSYSPSNLASSSSSPPALSTNNPSTPSFSSGSGGSNGSRNSGSGASSGSAGAASSAGPWSPGQTGGVAGSGGGSSTGGNSSGQSGATTLPIGGIVGIVVGVIALLAFIAFCIWRRRKANRRGVGPTQAQSDVMVSPGGVGRVEMRQNSAVAPPPFGQSKTLSQKPETPTDKADPAFLAAMQAGEEQGRNMPVAPPPAYTHSSKPDVIQSTPHKGVFLDQDGNDDGAIFWSSDRRSRSQKPDSPDIQGPPPIITHYRQSALDGSVSPLRRSASIVPQQSPQTSMSNPFVTEPESEPDHHNFLPTSLERNQRRGDTEIRRRTSGIPSRNPHDDEPDGQGDTLVYKRSVNSSASESAASRNKSTASRTSQTSSSGFVWEDFVGGEGGREALLGRQDGKKDRRSRRSAK